MNEKKVNILHLQNYLSISCGISKTIYLITKNTSSQFIHNILCFGGDGFSRFESINIKPLVLKEHNNSPIGFIKNLIRIYLYCKQNKISIIHSHHRYFDLLAFFIARILKIKTVTSVHSKVFNKKYFSYKADVLVACSNSIREHLINEFQINERRIKVIFNCVDPMEFEFTQSKTELINSLGIPLNKFIIGYIGRLNFNEKGIDILLEAFRDLSKSHKNLFLLLVGNGTDENKIKEFITKNKLSVKMMNSKEDIFNYYQLLDLFILPSRIEPFGIVILEAGISRIPFIGSKVDGIAELIEDQTNGLLFESGNPIDLQNKILQIYKDKNLANLLAENLFYKVIANYTVKSVIPQYEKLYLNLHDEKY